MILGFAFTVLFWPYIASAATTPHWAFVAIVTGVSLFFIRVRFTTSHALFISVLVYAAISLAWSPVPVEWLANYARLLITFALFLIAAELKTIKPLLIGAALGMCINGGFVYAQAYGWNGIPQVSPPAGLFMNKDMGAEYAVLLIIGLAYHRLWWFIPPLMLSVVAVAIPHLADPAAPWTANPSIIFSRGASLALVAVFAVALLHRWPRALIGTAAVGAAALMVYALIGDGSSVERLAIWQDTINGFTFWGHGFGSYYTVYPEFGHRVDTLYARPEHAHNDLLEFIYEMGIGTVLVLALGMALWRGKCAAERAILLGFAVESMVSFPIHMPATAAVFAVVAGRCAGCGPDLRRDLDAGRAILRLWLGQLRKLRHRETAVGNGKSPVPIGVPDPQRAELLLRRYGTDLDGEEYGDRAD